MSLQFGKMVAPLQYQQNNKQRQIEDNKFDAKLGATYIIPEIITKDNLNKSILMWTFENHLLQICPTEYLDISKR